TSALRRCRGAGSRQNGDLPEALRAQRPRRWYATRSLAPLDRAPDRGDLVPGSVAGARNTQHRLVEIAARVRHGARPGSVQPAAVLQPELRVEPEKIRRALGAVGFCDRLRFV